MPLSRLFVALGLLTACQGPAAPASPASHSRAAPCDEHAPLPAFERSVGGVPEVSADWLLAHRCQVRLVDVREGWELDTGRIPSSEHVPLGRVGEAAMGWDPEQPVVFVCRSGRRSARAARTLEDMGFGNVASLTGGMMVWTAGGRESVSRPARASSDEAAVEPPAGSGPLRASDVAEHLGDPSQVRWVKAAALLMQGTESCVDGRERRPVVGTPGGDAGELLLLLAALEAVREEPISDVELSRLLDAHLEAFGRFYIHTDTHAIESLVDVPALQEAVARRGAESLIRHPPRELEPALLEALSRPEHVGCGHLRLILQDPEEYGVRPALARGLLQRVMRRYWQGEPIELVVLQGAHHEGAVVEVRLDHEVEAFSSIPTIAPRLGDRELFVSHPEVSAWLRSLNARFLFEVDPWLRSHPEARARFLETVETLGHQQLVATLDHLARTLPRFSAHVRSDGLNVESIEAPRSAR